MYANSRANLSWRLRLSRNRREALSTTSYSRHHFAGMPNRLKPVVKPTERRCELRKAPRKTVLHERKILYSIDPERPLLRSDNTTKEHHCTKSLADGTNVTNANITSSFFTSAIPIIVAMMIVICMWGRGAPMTV